MCKNFSLLFFCMLSFVPCAFSQKVLEGRVLDYYTNQVYLDTLTQVYLLTPDSIVVEQGFVGPEYNEKLKKDDVKYYIEIRQEGNYIVKCENPNCETTCYPISIKFHKREDFIEGKDFRLKKKISKTIDLQEVSVNATMLKFCFSGDTLVFSADFFVTQYGLVLNDILQKLPGISMGPGYELYSNGRKIDEVLLNGKDFFNNDRETLIENMPAYMIKNIKVYEHSDSLELLKKMNRRPPLALDIRLKKGYNSAILGNIDIGTGTDSRYYGRLFSMKIHDLYHWTAFAVSNNTNHNEQIDHNGQLYNMDEGTGDKRFHIAGLNYNVDSPSDVYKIDGKFRIQGSNEKGMYRQLDDVFLSGGDAYTLKSQNTEARNFSLQTNHTFDLFPRRRYNLTISPSLVYVRSKSNIDMAQLSSSANIAEIVGTNWADSIRSSKLSQKLLMYGINRVLNKQYTPTYSTQIQLNVNQLYNVPHTPEFIGLELSGLYTSQSTEKFEHYGIDYINRVQIKNTFKNLYQNNAIKNLQWSAKASYKTLLNDRHNFGVDINFVHAYSDVDKNCYNLAALSGWGTNTEDELGMLPSQQSLLETIERGNSYQYRENMNNYTFSIHYSLEWNEHTIQVVFPLSIQRKTLDFYQDMNNQIVERQMFSPDLSLKLMKWMHGSTGTSYTFNFTLSNSMPALFNLVKQRSDTYEVHLSQGNQELKNSVNYKMSGTYTWRPVPMHNHAVSASYNYYKDKVGTALFYDREQGKYLYTPRNINGNQDASIVLTNSFYLDKSYKHKLSNNVSFTYIKSVDYCGTSKAEYNSESTVYNSILSEKMEYQFLSRNTKYMGVVAPYFTFHRSSSRRLGFETINACMFGLQISTRIELPASFRFTSELKSESRRGYRDGSMNDNEIIWNMGLTKSFKKNITLSLNAVDVLGQRNNIYKVVTAQGTSESVSNTLKRHIMLHFIWQFNNRRVQK